MLRIECGPCVVREFVPADAPTIARHADNRKIWLALLDRFPHPYNLEDAEGFIRDAIARQPPTNLAIEVEGQAAGSIGLVLGRDIERRSAEIGYWLGEPFWGRGVMTAAVKAVSDYGFQTFNLIRIYARPFERNLASARVLEKAGYEREGVMRSSVEKDGEILNTYLYSKIRDPAD